MDITLAGYFYFAITVVFLLCLYHYSYKYNHSVFAWWIGGFTYNLWSISFLYSAFPLSWSSNHIAQFVGFTFLIITNAIVAGSTFMLVGKYIQKYNSNKFFIPFLGLIFYFQDLLRSLFLSLFNLGEESRLGFDLILGSLGQSVSYTPLVIFAYGGGVFLLTGILGVATYILYKCELKNVFLFLIILSVWYFCIINISHINFPRLSFGVITTDYADPTPDSVAKNYTARTKSIASLLATREDVYDIVVLPESSFFVEINQSLNFLPKLPTHLILDGITIFKLNKKTNATLFYNVDTDTASISEKKYLMPMSEYTPYVATPLVFLTTSPKDFLRYKEEHSYKRGGAKNISSYKGARVATMLCSEATSYSAIREVQKLNPDIIILQSNLSVYHGRKLSFLQVLSYSKLLSATTGTPLISSNNSSLSFIISRFGEVVKTIPKGNFLTSITVNGDSVQINE